MDKLTKERRSWNMSKIHSKDTLPEILVRKALWNMGYRYRLHYKFLPGKSDIVLTKQKTVFLSTAVFGIDTKIVLKHRARRQIQNTEKKRYAKPLKGTKKIKRKYKRLTGA